MELPSEIVEAEGHLVDSQVLAQIFDRVIAADGVFEVLKFDLGRTNEDFSRLRLRVSAPSPEALRELVEELVPLGCRPEIQEDALLRVVDKDGCAPDDFYSTTNQHTHIRLGGLWIEVQHQRMDAAVVIERDNPECRKLRDLRAGDRVVCGLAGVRVVPEFRARDRLGFAFMANEVSSERRVEAAVQRIAAMIRDVRTGGGRVVFVAGPVVVHTGGVPYFCELIRKGIVGAVLAGNALAVHDAESSLYGTSLGVSLESGIPVEGGHRHHMRAINAVIRAGGIAAAVRHNIIKDGIMAECVRHDIPFVLAGSIRDDGPLPDTVMNLIDAQDRYAELLTDAQMVIVLGSMLHGIGVGNMLPAWVPMVCVDINPAVVTKLADRGSSQTVGVITDVGLFLHQLARRID